MALVVKDRVRVTTTTTGTSDFSLGSAVTGYQSFSVIGNNNTTYYVAVDPSTGDWEVGVGTFLSAGPTLTRDTILESSNAGSKVVFAAGTKDVFVSYPAERAVYLNAAGSAVDVLDIGTLGTSTANISNANITAGTVATTPTSATDIANKTYVDTIASSGITYHTPVKYEVPNTTGNLNATYNNGVAGVGATLTNAGTKAAFAPDGPTAQVGDRILVYNQTNAFENGIYEVTTVGTPDPGGTNWVLTRTSDANSYGVKDPNKLGNGDAFFITSGNTGAGETYVCNTVGTITFGTTAITFVQVSDATLYTAGTGLTLSGTQFSITPVGTAGTYGSASQVPVIVTNASGQVSGVTNTAIAITSGAVSGLAASATTDTTNAANITSGTLPIARLSGSYTGISGVGTLTVGTWNAGTIGVSYGGTGLTSYAVGDLLYADTTTSLAKLADVVVGNALISGGVGTAPSWGKIGLTTHVSGTLGVANGGTGAATLTGYVYGNGTSAFSASTTIPNAATTATSTNTASAIVARDASGNFAAGTITAALSGNATSATSATSATTATNLASGSAGTIPYQSAASTTAMLAAGTSGQYLKSNGAAAPSWDTLPAIGNGTLTMNVSGTGLSGSTTFTANQSGNSTFTVTSNATSANTASTIVSRDASGNFIAGIVTTAWGGYALPDTGASTQWIYLGRWSGMTQAGAKLQIKIVAAAGYNASIAQNCLTEIYFKTSNGSSFQAGSTGNFFADGQAWRTGPNATTPSTIRVVQTNTTTYDIYGNFATYSGVNSFYTVSVANGSWTNYSTTSVAPAGNFIDLPVYQVLDSSNYNTYAPTLTGTGASGTWGINITGNAATATTASNVNNGTLTLGTSGTGISGSATFTANQSGNATFTVTSNASSANNTGAIVARDASGNFAAGTITANLTGTATTATNLGAGAAGSIPYQTAANATAMLSIGTAGQYLTVGGAGAPVWSTFPTIGGGTLTMGVSGTGLSGSATFNANQSGNATFTVTSNATDANTASTIVARNASGNFSAGTITASLSGNATSATTATNLAGGSAGTVPYQSAAGTTAMLAAGTAGQYLQSNGAAAPSWATLPTIGNGTLTLAVSGNGLSGSATFTANQSGGATFTVTSNATAANTASTIAYRDTSSGFAIGYLNNNTWYTYNDNDRNANSATYYPNASTRAVRYFFANSTTTGTGGNYAGVLQFNPWTGTTASTGDASYQLAFGSTAANNGGIPQLNIRKGIDTTWNSWYTILHSGNYNSYSPTLSGAGANGTWGINVTGYSANVLNAVTFNNGGAGGASGSTFNGSSALTVSYNTVGAPSTTGTNASGTWGISITGNSATATTATTADALNISNNYRVNSIGVGAAASGTAGRINATTGVFTPGTLGVSTGLTVVNGDITAYRTGGTTGVIYLSSSGSHYLYWDSFNYLLGGNIALTAANYNSYSPTLTGTGASGTWGINVTGTSANVTGTVAVGNGGTGLTSWTASGIVYASATNALANTSNFVYDATNIRLGVGGTPTTRIHSIGTGVSGSMILESTGTLNSQTTIFSFSRSNTTAMLAQTVGALQWTRKLTDATDNLAGSISLSGNNTAGSQTANMTIEALTSVALRTGGTTRATVSSTGMVVPLDLQASTFNGGQMSGFRNMVINGGMVIDQRNNGAAVVYTAATQTYVVDRFGCFGTLAGKFTIQRNQGSVTPPAGFSNYLGVTSSAATTPGATDLYALFHKIEGFNFSRASFGTANAQSLILSFWVRSSITGTFGGGCFNSAANRNYVFSYSISTANTWERKSITIPGYTTGTWLTDNGVGFQWWTDLGSGSSNRGAAGSWTTNVFYGVTGGASIVGTSGATFYITGVQLEVGTAVTPFEHRNVATEFSMCQRYYEVGSDISLWSGYAVNGSTYYSLCRFATTKRASPTVVSTYVAAAGFPATAPATLANRSDQFWASAVCNVTSNGGYFQFSWTANAEL